VENMIVKNCAMQLDLIDRAIAQYTQPDETVYDPFGGLMSVPYRAIAAGRKAIATELNRGYFLDGVMYCRQAEEQRSAPTLFDLTAAEEDETESGEEEEPWDLHENRFTEATAS